MSTSMSGLGLSQASAISPYALQNLSNFSGTDPNAYLQQHAAQYGVGQGQLSFMMQLNSQLAPARGQVAAAMQSYQQYQIRKQAEAAQQAAQQQMQQQLLAQLSQQTSQGNGNPSDMMSLLLSMMGGLSGSGVASTSSTTSKSGSNDMMTMMTLLMVVMMGGMGGQLKTN